MSDTLAKGVTWDLSDLYASIEDPKIHADLDLAEAKSLAFEKKYKPLFDSPAPEATLDLASLLRDSYLSLPEDLIGELIDYYFGRKQDLEGVRVDRKQFLRLFDYMSIQRNLKAAGRFAYINSVKHNPNYLQFIPPTLGYARKNLSKYPELGEIQKVLSRYVEDLR